MNRTVSRLRWCSFRWVIAAGAVAALSACGARRLVAPLPDVGTVVRVEIPAGPHVEMDLLFVIDNSMSMRPLQQKLAQRLPDFMKVLEDLPGGLPDLHVAVASTSLGAGIYGNVRGCEPGHPGNDDGRFQHAQTCTLHAGQTFIRTKPDDRNFDGSIEDVFSCIALLGDTGCGFEHPFESTTLALTKAGNDADPDNGGFLRPNAYLGIVMLTNEDDCSVAADSTLFDPNQASPASALGALQSYRCNEFGHLCAGQPPPHDVTGAVPLGDCVPAEGRGRLTTTAGFVDFVKRLKADPAKIFVAALAGPPTPYVIVPQSTLTAAGTAETQPAVQHSCTAANGDYADPAVRISRWLDAFGDNAVFESICADDFKPAMVRIAHALSRPIRPPCITGKVTTRADGAPDCVASLHALPGHTAPATGEVPACDPGGQAVPCWKLTHDPVVCPDGQAVRICWNVACDATKVAADAQPILFTCAVEAAR